MKVFVVISFADGEDYNDFEPQIDGVFLKKENAMDQFVETCKEFAPEEGENAEEIEGNCYYEVTNFDRDYHAFIKIVEEEVLG